MFIMNFKMALNSLRGSKLRTLLTLLGIIIGVVSVVTFISFGEGLKAQVTDEIRSFGNDFLQVNPGESIIRDEQGNIEEFDFTAFFSAPPLSEKSLNAVKKVENVRLAAGVMLVGSSVSVGENEQKGATVMATEPPMLEIMGQEVEEGSFLSDDIENEFVVVLGSSIKNELFGESPALGRKVTIKSKEFTVIGVLKEYQSLLAGGLGGGSDINRYSYIPIAAGKTLNQGTAGFMEFDIKVADVQKIDETIAEITRVITETRGDDDFSVSKPEEFLDTVDQILSLMTTAVTAIASISVLVGGIGIMNIMFVTVSERTREIGIRKAIGATNKQILMQFLIEAVVITLLGAAIGIGISAFISLLVGMFTEFSPSLTLTSVIIAVLSSVVFGVVFGIVPAVKAARKDPIESLRHD